MAELKPTAPPYPDILLENTVITDEIKYNVMTKRWNDVHLFQFPARLMKPMPGVSEEIMKLIHDDIIKQLDSNIRSELEQMYKEEAVENLLNGLDQLVTACPRTGSPAWRPSGEAEKDRQTHVASLKRLKLQVLQKQLGELEAQNQMLTRNVAKKEKQLLQSQGRVKTAVDDLQQVVEDEVTAVSTLINTKEV